MQYIVLVILIGMLGAGVVVLTWMGFVQRRRRRLLARVADEMEMRFSPDDPFDLTDRYSDFALSSAGHSQRAENVLYGQYEGWYLRVYDYHYEAGHGPRRLARRYSIIVADTNLDLPAALLWHAGDAERAPLSARRGMGRLGPWLIAAGADFAGALADAFVDFADVPVSVQTCRRSVMLCSAARIKPRRLPAKVASAAAGLAALRARCPAG